MAIRSAMIENSMLDANLMALSFIEPEFSAIDVYVAAFWKFSSPVISTRPITFIYKLDPYSFEMFKCKLATSSLLTVVDRQRDIQNRPKL